MFVSKLLRTVANISDLTWKKQTNAEQFSWVSNVNVHAGSNSACADDNTADDEDVENIDENVDIDDDDDDLGWNMSVSQIDDDEVEYVNENTNIDDEADVDDEDDVCWWWWWWWWCLLREREASHKTFN